MADLVFGLTKDGWRSLRWSTKAAVHIMRLYQAVATKPHQIGPNPGIVTILIDDYHTHSGDIDYVSHLDELIGDDFGVHKEGV